MTWYMAVLVRGSFVDGTLDEERLGDKLFRLIEAPHAETAYRRAVERGEASKDDYTDDDGNTVQLRFLGLADLKEIATAPIGDGVEVYSELIGSRPGEVVLEKTRLTAFDAGEEALETDDSGSEKTGIRRARRRRRRTDPAGLPTNSWRYAAAKDP